MDIYGSFIKERNGKNNNKGSDNRDIYERISVLYPNGNIDPFVADYSNFVNNMNKNDCYQDNKCDITNCGYIARGYRNERALVDGDKDARKKLYHSQNNEINIVIAQMLDCAHNVLFHIFDMGYKVKMDDIKKDEQQTEEKKNEQDQDDDNEKQIKCGLDLLAAFLIEKNKKNTQKVTSLNSWLKDKEFDSDGLVADLHNDDRSNIEDYLNDDDYYKKIQEYIAKKEMVFGRDINGDDDNDSTFSSEIEQIKNILNVRKNHFENIRPDLKNNGNHNKKKFNKFVINVTGKYSFGKRYYYHDYYKNNKTKKEILPGTDDRMPEEGNKGYCYNDWYIAAKYGSLEEEVLNNSICRLQLYQWKITITKATFKWNKLKNKDIVNTARFWWEIVYGIKKGSLITLDHIIALLLYTNWTELCTEFSATYRKSKEDESDKELKARHAEYCIWAKLLRETVEVYGTGLNESNLKSFYTGLSAPMIFDSFSVYICCPLSTAAS